MRKLVLAASIAVVCFALPAAAAPGSSVAMSAGQKVTRSGHLEGASAAGFVLAPYQAGVSDQLCTPSACDDLTVIVRLPKGQRSGELTATASAPLRNAGLNLRIFNARGELVSAASGGGAGAGVADAQSSVGAQARGIPAGRYTVRLYLSAGVADFVETLTWRATRTSR